MIGKYKLGDTVYIVESGNCISECTIINYSGGLYTIRLLETGGAIKLKESRLFLSKEEAQKTVRKDIRREWH